MAETTTIRPGYRFRIGNRPYLLGSVNEYRARYKEEPEEADYPYIIAEATVIADDGGRTARELRERPELEFNAILRIEGLGLYALVAPSSRFLDGDFPALIPLEGQAAAEQAEKRMLRSIAAREGYEVRRTRPYPVMDSS